MKCTVKFKLIEITCPGILHLTNRNPVFLTIHLFGRIQCSQKIYPSFPIEINMKRKFQRCFTNAKTPDHVLEILEDETILIELRQKSRTNKVIAQFEESARQFLFPSKSYIPKQDEMKREIFLIKNQNFIPTKSLDPQLIFSTKTSMEEVHGPCMDLSPATNNLSKGTNNLIHSLSMYDYTDNSIGYNLSKYSKSHYDNEMTINSTIVTNNNDMNKSSMGTSTNHCICKCPVLSTHSDVLEMFQSHNISKSKQQDTKPFRTGKEHENLISKRSFADGGRNQSYHHIKTEGFCNDCVIPLDTCTLCNAYKIVYGNETFLKHRFKKLKQLQSGEQNKSPRRRSKSNPSAVFQKVSAESPVKITVNNNSIDYTKDKKYSINNRKKFTRKINSTSKYNHDSQLDISNNLNSTSASPYRSNYLFNRDHKHFDDSDDEILAESALLAPTSPVLPSKTFDHSIKSELYNKVKEDESIHNKSISFADKTIHLPHSRRSGRTKLFEHSKNYRLVNAKEKDYGETNRIQQRIKDLMRKNHSVLEHDVSLSDEELDQKCLFSFDEGPVSTSSQKKLVPAKSYVAPATKYSCWSKDHVGKSHREMIDSSLNVIYSDLYDKISKHK